MTQHFSTSNVPEVNIPLPTRRSTRLLAQRIAATLRIGDLLILSGPLGAGKTFLTRGIARGLGLSENVAVTSPTFALVQEFETQPPLVHADLYRLNHADQLRDLGLLHRRDDAVLVVEWGEAYVQELGGDAILLKLQREPRAATLQATGPRASRRVEQIRDSGIDTRE